MSCTHNKPTANEEVGPVTLTKGRDPTGTHAIQRAFVRDLLRRFKRVRGLVRATVGYENDALFLKQDAKPPGIRINAEPEEAFDFPTEEDRIDAFIRALQAWLAEEVINPVTPLEVQNGEHWTAEYLDAAYVSGVNTAEGRLMQEGVSIEASDAQEALSRPIAVSQLRDIYTRTYENLTDITDDTAQIVREELTEAIREGENPRKVATRINRQIEDITNTRATTLARTEIIHSSTTATLDQYEDAGVNVVSHVEWADSNDDRVCPFCSRLDGLEFTTQEARNASVSWSVEPDWKDQIWRLAPPAHPSCRCAILPVIGAETPDKPLEDRIAKEFDRATVRTGT